MSSSPATFDNAVTSLFTEMPPKRKSKKRAQSDAIPVQTLDKDRQNEILMTFRHALNKGEQMVSLSVAKKCLKNLGLDSKSDEIQSFFGHNEGDPSPMEYLDEDSFLQFASSKAIQVDKAYKAFELIDQDGKGVIVVEDLQRVAQELGEEMSAEELQEMIEFADRSGDGLLTAQDISRIARKVNLS